MSQAHRRLFQSICAVLTVVLVSTALGGQAATAKVPRPPHRYTALIEPLADYVGQRVCSPAAKPGTQAFANMLLRTYRNSRSLGISRSCTVGGVSEHKEGRAFDWGVSVHNPRDRRSVKALLHWLLKTDRFGNRHAMARRLGIQYIIWNRRIWGAYAASSGWRRYTGSNPHTDHVHFSLSWAGARKKTSFWHPRDFPHNSGVVPKPPTPPKPSDPEPPGTPTGHPQPDPDSTRPPRRDGIPEPQAPERLAAAPALVQEQVWVPVDRRAGVRPERALVRGHEYLIEVSGTYHYAKGRQSVADAECSSARGSWWQRDRSLRWEEWGSDHLDLYIDGHDLYGQADDGQSCDLDTHTYRWVYEAERDGRAPLAVWDPTRYRDNRGRLRVTITDLDQARDTMSWTVPARVEAGVTSPGTVPGGQDYLVTVRGTWQDGRGVTADTECTRTDSDATWRRSRSSGYGDDSHDLVLGEFGQDSLVPQLAGVRTEPVTDTGDRCDAEDHAYTFVWHPERTEPLHLRVDDPGSYRDNSGALRVRLRPYVADEGGSGDGGTTPSPTPTPTPTPSPEPEPVTTESLRVDAAKATPVQTRQSFPEGTRLRLTVSGWYVMRYSSDWIAADAECTMTSSDRTWRSTRYDGRFNGSWSPLGDLALNGRLVDWRPSDRDGSCDEEQHVYTVWLTTDRDGPLSLVVADSDYGDNRGELAVTVDPR